MAGANGANGTNGANGVKTNGEKYGESGFASDAEIGMMKLRSRTRASGGGDKSVNGNLDVEELAEAESHLRNDTVTSFAWRGVTVTVKDRKTKEPRNIVDGVDGIVRSGKCGTARPSETRWPR